jgi:hypothetical protein
VSYIPDIRTLLAVALAYAFCRREPHPPTPSPRAGRAGKRGVHPARSPPAQTPQVPAQPPAYHCRKNNPNQQKSIPRAIVYNYTKSSCYLQVSQEGSPPSPPLKKGGDMLKAPLFKGGKGGIWMLGLVSSNLGYNIGSLPIELTYDSSHST